MLDQREAFRVNEKEYEDGNSAQSIAPSYQAIYFRHGKDLTKGEIAFLNVVTNCISFHFRLLL